MSHLVRLKLKSKKLFMNTDITVLVPELQDGGPVWKKHKVLWLPRGDGRADPGI